MIIAGYLLIAAAAVVGWLLFRWIDPKFGTPAAGFSIFAPMYILAQAIERVLEPFTSMLASAASPDGSTVKKASAITQRDAAFALLAASPTEANAAAAAASQSTVETVRRNTAVIAWGLASAVAIIACGAFGIRLMLVAGFHIRPFFDILITGLAIGSGTKPLHDLISNIQKAKDGKSDPPNVVTTAG